MQPNTVTSEVAARTPPHAGLRIYIKSGVAVLGKGRAEEWLRIRCAGNCKEELPLPGLHMRHAVAGQLRVGAGWVGQRQTGVQAGWQRFCLSEF